jgi:hypothetical protein
MHQSFDHDQQPKPGAPQRHLPRRGFVGELEFIAYRVCTFSLFPSLLRQDSAVAHTSRETRPTTLAESMRRPAA